MEAKIQARIGGFRLAANIDGSGVMCVAGSNGAGKTSLMKVIAGFIPLEDGYIKMGGRDISKLPVEKREVVLVTPNSALFHLDVESHLRWGARLRGRKPGTEEVTKVKAELGIDFGGAVRTLSLGMRERVSLATALLARPRAVLVDEVFSSLHNKEDFIASYGRLTKDSGIDLLFTSQNESDGRMAEQVYVMDNGSTIRRR